jgi:hypothetical protein
MFTRMAMAAAGVEFMLIENNMITNYARLPLATAEQTFDRDFNIISIEGFKDETRAWNQQLRRMVDGE